MFNYYNHQYFIKFLIFIGVLGLSGCPSNPPKSVVSSPSPAITNKQQSLQTSSLTIGILSKPSYYEELTTYLREQFGNKVQIVIDGDESISYEEARKRMINKEWDIAFTLSPILSLAAKNNDYHFAARMFPNNPPYYQATLFTKSTSSIQSINDLKPINTIALGDFNSASSFYVPAYDLFGKSLRVDMGHRGKDIKELVKTGKTDVGAAAYEAVEKDKDLKIIHLSKKIPGANVYLSPKLSESDRQIITKVLLNAPENIRKEANYGGGDESDYSQLIKISQRTEEILRCANFQLNPVNFYCSDSPPEPKPSISPDTSEILGRINGWSRQNNEDEAFKLSGKDNKIYQIIIPRKVLDQVPGASNPIALQGKEVKIINVAPQKAQAGIFELKLTQPNQLNILEDIPNSSIQSNYQVKQVDDGDTITVTDVSNQEIRVRFACIDAAEISHSDTEQNSNKPADINQFLWGNKAKERLKTLIQKGGNQVLLNIVDTDRYGRKVAEVRLPDGTFAQQVLVREGLAMVYRQYIKSCPSATDVEQAEIDAKQQQLNIWADSQFTPPWDWRRDRKPSLKKQAKV
ncbi:PhnD/SsuA/transferrin family substrate-binding protein [Nostoc sp. FACHB-133]|uniref:PhnD/SsuA/transferrin family substrate-binding protein n=1 Tax=Nostoc sp. FACHB-133 TaxID=2692835 RepID=UPI0016868258|nr:PhnD/SsuA/transferrin family substrate-binding protein [Nostoc sp. FACHB-133]MBD2527776.1 PhnD/SsuA/transferrin family substrate-binding protein [Nostoc sp. FACHB-133]